MTTTSAVRVRQLPVHATACIDGNEAAARVAYAFSEVIPIYPITPSSPMAELADEWAAAGRVNLWGSIPEVVQMQSEAGAAGTLHGAVQVGACATTFTASQGLLLMIPNMFKVAGELTPCAMHVAARTVATHALSIFGDHSDVMHARTTGWAMLAAGSVQEAHDFAAVAHAATLRTRVPFIHFFDGFRTSHEINRITLLDDADLRALIDERALLDHRNRGLSPDAPRLRGSAQNPDVYFQAREAVNPFYDALPAVVEDLFGELAARCGRSYQLIDYVGAADADRVVVLMGSGAGAAEETVGAMCAAGERVGLLKVRLYRPFPADHLVQALPPTVRAVAVLDRTKEPGATGEPLLLDVIASLHDAMDRDAPPFERMPHVIGGRYGLSSKEFRPAHVRAVFDELASFDVTGGPAPRRRFTVGIRDDVTHLSLEVDDSFRVARPPGEVQAMFFGLGADGTVGANKASVKIISEHTDLFAQGYFVYDSKKAGSVTVSHLRFGPDPITSTYLIEDADFVACHQFGLVEKMSVLERARPGATFLLNCPYGERDVWSHLPSEVRDLCIDKQLDFWVIDADRVARDHQLGSRINTVMQPCFFALAGVLPADEAIAHIKASVERMYGGRGSVIVERNHAAIDAALAALVHIAVPTERSTPAAVETGATWPADTADDTRVGRLTTLLIGGHGDSLPVSALPVDGTFLTGTAHLEKRAIARQLPIWDPDICIDCGKCAIVCPHATIRMKVFEPSALQGAPSTFRSKAFRSKDIAGYRMTIQVAPDDCTGCGVCVDVCPAKSKTEVRHKAINMEPATTHRDVERPGWDFFLSIPELDRQLLPHDSVKGSQALQPLFEFSGACAGCGETPYLKLATQLFGDRMVVANATGCSSIYGGNLPTTPWTVNADGRGPAWSNSLFEDNAEFGLGLRIGLEGRTALARRLLVELADVIGTDLAIAILDADQGSEAGLLAQRERVGAVRALLGPLADASGDTAVAASRLLAVVDDLTRRSVWIVGGDGWAYDIGFGGLDHVVSSGRDVNILVLDTEVYSNTGGQASKATSRGAVAKFAAAGKPSGKKDLGAIARAYGNVYVAEIAIGANDLQATKALLEAEAWPGPSLVIAYSTCIAHGIDMATSMSHQRDAVKSGYWPLYRFHPSDAEHGTPFKLDSHEPSIPLADFVATEARFALLARTHPERARQLLELAQSDVDERWRYYRQLGTIERTIARHSPGAPEPASDDEGRP